MTNKDDKPICFISKKFNQAETNYSTYEELLAVVFTLKKLRHYLLGQEFTVFTDNNAVRHLVNKPDPNAKISRWILPMSEFKLVVHHIPGIRNVTADYLSRYPPKAQVYELGDETFLMERNDNEFEEALTCPDWSKEKSELQMIFKKTRNYFIHQNRLYRKTKDNIEWVVPKDLRF